MCIRKMAAFRGKPHSNSHTQEEALPIKQTSNKEQRTRREALRALATATGALSLAALPKNWRTPIIEVGALPAHAQASALLAPEIDIFQPSDTIWISDSEAINTPINNTYVIDINNTGTADLNLTGSPRVSLSGDPEFTLDTDASTPVPPGGSTSFVVRFVANTGSPQLFTTTISIANNDSDENPYTGTVQVFVL